MAPHGGPPRREGAGRPGRARGRAGPGGPLAAGLQRRGARGAGAGPGRRRLRAQRRLGGRHGPGPWPPPPSRGSPGTLGLSVVACRFTRVWSEGAFRVRGGAGGIDRAGGGTGRPTPLHPPAGPPALGFTPCPWRPAPSRPGTSRPLCAAVACRFNRGPTRRESASSRVLGRHRGERRASFHGQYMYPPFAPPPPERGTRRLLRLAFAPHPRAGRKTLLFTS